MKLYSNQKTPLPGVTVYHQVSTAITLSPEEVDKVFWERLMHISQNIYLKDDEIWQITTNYGDQTEEKVGMVGDPVWALPLAAYRLRQAILETSV